MLQDNYTDKSSSGCLARRGGQVLVLVLVAMTLLVGLVFYVYNLGNRVNRRLDMQNAADAAAISGAAWMARSMNLVALNNVTQARLLALVPILDALPLATEMSLHEVRQWEEGLLAQINRGLPTQKNCPLLAEAMNNLYRRLGPGDEPSSPGERLMLEKLDEALNRGSFDMSQTTAWPNGDLWQAMETLGALSRATAGSAGAMAQMAAEHYGRRSIQGPTKVAMLVPVAPAMPATTGSFDDFQPVLMGSIHVTNDGARYIRDSGRGGAIPDCQHPDDPQQGLLYRLGPFARLYRWRYTQREATAWESVPYDIDGYGSTRPGGGGRGLGGRSSGDSAIRSGGSGVHRRATAWRNLGYTTYGPYSWAIRHVRNWSAHHMPDTFFGDHVRDLADLKLGYIWAQRPVTLRQLHIPDWETDYVRATEIASADPQRIVRTLVYLFEIVSSVTRDDPRFLTSGTYRTNGSEPMAIWMRGWRDPSASMVMVDDYVWTNDYWYEITEDRDLGIERRTDENGDLIWSPVYVYQWYVFGGADIGGSVDVSNPCDWEDPSTANLPVPVLMAATPGDINTDYTPNCDNGWRRDLFTFLGVARGSDRSAVWPQRFGSSNPTHSMITLAQAELFNSTSWDLWTQDWRVQLMPVTRWREWAQRMQQGQPLAEAMGVDSAELLDAAEYIERLGSVSEMFDPVPQAQVD